MDGLQLQRLVHDENAGVGPSLNNKPGGLQQQSGLKPGPLSSRKALGNITNKSQQQDGGSCAEPSAAKPRRAFGELSTNRPAQQQAQQQNDGGKPAALKPARQAFGQVQQQAQQSAVAPLQQQQQQQQQDLAALYASGGVERYAGKTWQQLEEEREAEEEARAASAADRLTKRLAGWRVGGSTLKVAADEEEDEENGLLAPQQRPSAAAGPSTFAAAPSADPLAGLMGDDDLFGSSSGSPLDLLPDVTEGTTSPPRPQARPGTGGRRTRSHAAPTHSPGDVAVRAAPSPLLSPPQLFMNLWGAAAPQALAGHLQMTCSTPL